MRKLASQIYGRTRKRLGVLFDLSLELVCIFSLLGLIGTMFLFDAHPSPAQPFLRLSSGGEAPPDLR